MIMRNVKSNGTPKRLGLVLSSGGVDSTTVLALAIDTLGKENVIAVSINYGQKHNIELQRAEQISKFYGVEHKVLDLSNIFKSSNCSLLEHSTQEVSHGTYEEQIKENEIVNTYVPFRNGLMLSSVASLGMGLLMDRGYDKVDILIGAHADDSAGEAYADCSTDFIDTMGKATNIGTYGKVSVFAPYVNKHKNDIVNDGICLGVPYELTHSCYEGHEGACGQCGTCLDRIKAFAMNGCKDPIKYDIKIDWEKEISKYK